MLSCIVIKDHYGCFRFTHEEAQREEMIYASNTTGQVWNGVKSPDF